MARNVLIRLIQILVVFGMLILIFNHIELNKISHLFQKLTPSYIILAFFVLTCQIIVAAYRWIMILRLGGYSPPVFQCIGIFAVSSLINTTIPGGFGGDIVRTWITSRNGVTTSIAAYSVISDRLFNMTGYGLLVMLGLLSHLIAKNTIDFNSMDSISIIFGIILVIGFCALGLISRVYNNLKISIPLMLAPLFGLSNIIGRIFELNKIYKLVTINFLVHTLQIFSVFLLAYGLQAPLPLHVAFIELPQILLLSAIPITPGGWGVRESMMIFALKPFHIEPEIALAISILFGLGTILASLPTSICWLIFNWKSKPILSNEYAK